MIGKTISHYTIIEKLGEGGMGVVYKAHDTKLNRTVALKFLPPHIAPSDNEQKRFIHEAQSASALDHLNICTIHEIDESPQGQLFIVMSYYEGETLKSKIEQGPLKVEEAVDIAIQIAKGLAKAHTHGIVHRDIKPANIIITKDGVAKIVDFGLAKLGGQTLLTKTGTTIGTVAYMSPEQAQGNKVDHRTDIWSLGVVMYEMITGQRPFRGEYEQALIYLIINGEPEAITKLRKDISPGLDQIVGHALAKRADDRYRTMDEFREDLAAIAEGLKPLKAKPRPAAVKLAVLPLLNLTGDPDQEFLSDGLTMEMIARFGRLHPESLSVIARTSVMRYKKTDTPVDQIGRELGVDFVLEGSVQREDGRVRIIAELIRVGDQMQIWSDIFEREMSGILSLQNEFAKNVADALSIKLLPSEKSRLANARPVNPEAHEAYLRGSYQWMKFISSGDLDIAEKYFDLALEKDPLYAPAFAGRAWVWLIRNQWGWSPPEEAGPKAKAAALRAIELDESSAAYEALAMVRTFVEWDWEGAREPWRRTLELNPNVATAQAIYAHFLMIKGHGEKALEHSQRAVVLDPFNPLIHSWHAFVLYCQRRYDEAIAAAREALRFQPDFPIATNALWWIMHEKKGMESEAFEAAKDFARVTYNDPRIEAMLDEGYAQGEYAEAMKRGAEALVARLPETFCLPSDIAIFYTAAGEMDKAVEWIEKGLEIHDPVLPYLGLYSFFDGLRPDPRFQALLRRIGLQLFENK
jgi:eukaryotic-like serine/threonine-protein kinase